MQTFQDYSFSREAAILLKTERKVGYNYSFFSFAIIISSSSKNISIILLLLVLVVDNVEK